MLYSKACCYTIRAMAKLALMRPDGYVLMDELCDEGDLPRHFVAKQFQRVVHSGLLLSATGSGGGFALARPPDQITLHDIVACIDGTENFDQCVAGIDTCDNHPTCPLHAKFRPIRAEIKQFLLQTTLDSMSKALKRKKQARRTKKTIPGRKSKFGSNKK